MLNIRFGAEPLRFEAPRKRCGSATLVLSIILPALAWERDYFTEKKKHGRRK
jgi:hypothetical protein